MPTASSESRPEVTAKLRGDMKEARLHQLLVPPASAASRALAPALVQEASSALAGSLWAEVSSLGTILSGRKDQPCPGQAVLSASVGTTSLTSDTVGMSGRARSAGAPRDGNRRCCLTEGQVRWQGPTPDLCSHTPTGQASLWVYHPASGCSRRCVRLTCHPSLVSVVAPGSLP